MLVVMCIDGVLSGASGIPNAPSTLLGHSLYTSFADVSWALLTTAPSAAIAEQWLLQEGYTNWISLQAFGESHEDDPAAWKIKAIQAMLAANNKVTFYLDSDPTSVQCISAMGVPSMLIVPPESIPRYDGQYQPWDQLVSTLHERKARRVEQQRRSLE